MAALEQFLADAQATEAFGARLAECCRGGLLVFLHGDLGAGKTTLVRGLLRGLGYTGPVKSPTFTLIEPYHLTSRTVFHFDLYRVADPEELEYMGARDYFRERAVCLIEWPERASGWLTRPDLEVRLAYEADARRAYLSGKTEATLATYLPDCPRSAEI